MKLSSVLILFLSIISVSVVAKEKLRLEHSDQFEVQLINNQYVTYVVGNVHFVTETGHIYCDSAKWKKGEDVKLNGNVTVDDVKYSMKADSVFYDMGKEEYLALGKNVELWSFEDSVFAVGNNAFFDEGGEHFFMEDRPIMYLNYPDTTTMYEVIADQIDYFASSKEAEAYGNVKISSNEFSSISGCAKMKNDGNHLDLFENPSIQKGKSTIKGELITMHMKYNQIDYIDVLDSARADFKEPVDSIKNYYDESILSGDRILLYFKQGVMDNILCYGQAYSWYYPSSQGRGDYNENSVSGDTIKFIIEEDELNKIHVIGGAQGTYLSGKNQLVDSIVTKVIDTIDYNSNFIEYALTDSLITLKEKSHVKSGVVSLDAHFIEFDTDKNIIEAFSADIEADTVVNPYYLSEKIQPNIIPVLLKDGDEEIFGDYLLYSIDTEKGRIIQTKTDFTEGLYYGEKLYREHKDIYYVDNGRYTTCDADEPHFHFRSSNMKMIEGKRLIVKPVIFYIETIPILAFPYYVFPLEKGRHSGLLPFNFGKFEKGDRYISNVGYYWAASDYFDIKSAFDYYEQRRSINFYNKITFNKRYVLKGYIDANYTQTTSYNTFYGQEVKDPAWTVSGNYSHIISPSFNLSATGKFISDKKFISENSQNLEERQDRSIRSSLSFTKRFSKYVSLTGSASHTVNLDTETRNDVLPSLNLSLPSFYPFGSGKRNSEGVLEQKFYNSISIRYNPSLIHNSNRSFVDTVITTTYDFDSLYTIDSTLVDTIYVIDSTLMLDTLNTYVDTTNGYRTRKRFAVVTHSPTLYLPALNLGSYLHITPSVNYSEKWVKVYETDQSLDAGINPSKIYRYKSYSASASATTKLYGTLSPNMFGLMSIRHVITPSASFVYRPQIDNKNQDVTQYTGAGFSSNKSRTLAFTLNQLFQAKVRAGEEEKKIDLFSVVSSFGYDLEKDIRPLSDLTTRINSSALPIISGFTINMRHTFYNLTDSTEQFWSPQLLSFSFQASFRLAGSKFFFDDDYETPKGAKSKQDLQVEERSSSSSWSFNANYDYRESGVKENWGKSSFISFNLSFNLTPSTSIRYSQNYDITRNLTTSNTINVNRKIHCWTGTLYWVPSGSNSGFGFSLYVTKQPDIKLDNNYKSFSSTAINR